MKGSECGGGCALLVMHVQPPISDMVADDSWIDRIADALAAARGAAIPVIHVHIGFREGYPEVPPTNARRQQLEGGTCSFVVPRMPRTRRQRPSRGNRS